MAAVCNYAGEQIGCLQGTHEETVGALAANGTAWHELPDVLGAPMLDGRAVLR